MSWWRSLLVYGSVWKKRVEFWGLCCKQSESAVEGKTDDADIKSEKVTENAKDKVGRTYSYPNGRRPDSGGKALGDLSFQIGDYLDVAIL